MIGTNELRVVNIGLPSFADVAATVAHASVTHLDWRPPLDADPQTARLVQRTLANTRIDEANGRAFDRYIASEPRIIDVVAADVAIPTLHVSRLLLHAGPPIDVANMCGPMRGALIGAILFEGWAATADDAASLLDTGGVRCEPCHHHGAVGPMAGVVSPSMPVWVVEDASNCHRAFATLNEGLGKVLRFGAYSTEVVDRLRWMAVELGPALGRVIRGLGGVAVKPLIAQALHMGDEVHNRNTASSGQLLKLLAPKVAELETSPVAASVLAFVASNDHFFLNISMALSKVMLDAAGGEPDSTMVTAMARNGVEFGIRTAGTGDAWFCAPALAVDGLYFPGYGSTEANPDLGDSAITETAGLGGFSMAAAPAIVGFVGGTPAHAIAHSLRMRDITIGVNPAFTIPALGFASAAAGIDTRLVVDTAILPVINTGIAHREAGVGQIGAGITNAPWTCFRDALRALDARQAKA
jgi:hypothetical protein